MKSYEELNELFGNQNWGGQLEYCEYLSGLHLYAFHIDPDPGETNPHKKGSFNSLRCLNENTSKIELLDMLDYCEYEGEKIRIMPTGIPKTLNDLLDPLGTGLMAHLRQIYH